MKNRLFTPFCLVATLVLAENFAMAAPADVRDFLVTKGKDFRQTNASAPVQIKAESPFRFAAIVEPSNPGSVTNATIRLPNKQTKTLTAPTLDLPGDVFDFHQSFSNKAMLDAAFGKGLYTFTIDTVSDGERTPGLKLLADAYPLAPHISNWDDLQVADARLPLGIFWDPFVKSSTNDFMLLEIRNAEGNFVYQTPAPPESGMLDGTATSTNVPANTLAANQNYTGRLLFFKRTGLNTTNYPGATGLAGFNTQTRFPINTLPEPPPAGRIQFSARNYSVNEADGTATVTIVRSGADDESSASVTVTVTDGTAKSGSDYSEAGSATVNFGPGQFERTVTLDIIDDVFLEGKETINFALSDPVGGAILGPRTNAVLTIVDNEDPSVGVFSFGPTTYTVAEPRKQVILRVQRKGGKTGTATVNFSTSFGTAGNDDFTTTNGTLTFGPGKTSQAITIRISDDTIVEPKENFFVTLGSPSAGAALATNNTTATVSIQDNDIGGVIKFSSATLTAIEGTNRVVTVQRVGGKASGVTVDFEAFVIPTATFAGSKSIGDFIPTSGTLLFGANETLKTFSVQLTDDPLILSNRSFGLHLSNVTGGAKLGPLSNSIVKILDNDSSVSFVSDASVIEGKPVTLTIKRTGSLNTPCFVQVITSSTGGTATEGTDYVVLSTNVTFAPGVSTKTVVIKTLSDPVFESNETFKAILLDPVGVQLGAKTEATITLQNTPDPNGVPEAGAKFMTASISGFTALPGSVLATYYSSSHTINIAGAIGGASGLKTSNIGIIPAGPGVVTLNPSGSNGAFLYTQTSFTLPSFSAASNQPGGGGTVTIDVLDLANHVVTGRFSVTAIKNPGGAAITITGKFRAKIL